LDLYSVRAKERRSRDMSLWRGYSKEKWGEIAPIGSSQAGTREVEKGGVEKSEGFNGEEVTEFGGKRKRY